MANQYEMLYQLNRLANVTTAQSRFDRGAQAAANAYAGTTNLEVVGALNAKAGTSGLDLAGVANKLAGTTGLGVCEALSRI